MLYAFTYLGALLSLVITFSLATYLSLEAFQAVALGLLAGGFGAVICNLGTDQSQLPRLLDSKTAADRAREVLRNLGYRSIVYTALLVLMLTYLVNKESGLSQGTSVAIYFAWSALVGLQPNAYADFLHVQTRQQAMIVLERIYSSVIILFVFLFGADGSFETGIIIGITLLSTRVLITGYQWRAVLVEDRTRAADSACGSSNKTIRRYDSGGYLGPTIASLSNACTAYFPVLILDHFGYERELALYALVLQALGVVILSQGVASRLIATKIAAISPMAGVGPGSVALRSATDVLKGSVILALFAGIATATYMINADRYGSPQTIISLVIILFSWGAWLGFGQVVTRALVSHGHAGAYAWAAALTAFTSAIAGWAFVPHHGVIASTLSIVLPHSAMIVFCAILLYRVLPGHIHGLA